MPPREEWRRYVAPVAFLLGVTIAVILVRQGLTHPTPPASPSAVAVTTTRKHVAVTTTTTKRHTTTTASKKEFWTVKAGDTFGVISSQSGVPVSTIEQLNPNVSSTALFIGEKIRVR